MFYDRKLTIFGLSSLSLTDNEKYLLKNSNNIFGIILFARNVANKAQLKSLIQEIRAYKPNLNILIDEEGGRVTRLSNIYPQDLRKEFIKLHSELKEYENHPFERRAFLYLDILSWLESKINNVTVESVIQQKAKKLLK